MSAEQALKIMRGVRTNLPNEEMKPEDFLERCDTMVALIKSARVEMASEIKSKKNLRSGDEAFSN